MNAGQLKFCENYEKTAREFELLELVKDQLAPKGLDIYQKKKVYLHSKLDLYLRITGA